MAASPQLNIFVAIPETLVIEHILVHLNPKVHAPAHAPAHVTAAQWATGA